MKLKLFAIIAMMWVSFSVWAQCPDQGAAVELLNGTDVDEGDAEAYTKNLRDLVFEIHPEINKDCVTFTHSYNTNEPYFLDFLEAGLQKSEEITGDGIAFLKQYFRLIPTANWFDDLVVDTLFVPINGAIGLGQYFLGDQVNEHLAAYALHTAPFTQGGQRKRLILVGHSQGSEMAVIERNRLSLPDQDETFVVAVSALAVPEPDFSLYTTLDKDNLATVIFARLGAPPANVALASEADCSDFGSSPWHCHALDGVYFTLPETRGKVADDIAAVLPQDILPSGKGRVRGILTDRNTGEPVGGVSLSVLCFDTSQFDGEAVTDSAGEYDLVAEQCASASVTGFKAGDNRCAFSQPFTIEAGQTHIQDLDFSIENCPQLQ